MHVKYNLRTNHFLSLTFTAYSYLSVLDRVYIHALDSFVDLWLHFNVFAFTGNIVLLLLLLHIYLWYYFTTLLNSLHV